jgi:hypothetical protein
VAEWLLALCADLTPASAICLAVALFAVSLVPFFLFINTDFVAAAHTARLALLELWVQAALTLAALLILTIPNGDAR